MSDTAKIRKSLVNYLSEVVHYNIEFLVDNCREVVDECFNLSNDLIDYLFCLTQTSNVAKGVEVYLRYMMYPMIIHVAYPCVSYSVFALFQGAIPQIYYSLRTALEAIGIAVFADEESGFNNADWVTKIEMDSVKHASLFKLRGSLHKIFEQVFKDKAQLYLDAILNTYESLSAWLHPTARIRIGKNREVAAGLLKAIALTIIEKGRPPSYGFQVPMRYSKADIEDLKHLQANIKWTRNSLAILLFTWAYTKDFINKEIIVKHFEQARNDVENL